jgi:hypothetical protein
LPVRGFGLQSTHGSHERCNVFTLLSVSAGTFRIFTVQFITAGKVIRLADPDLRREIELMAPPDAQNRLQIRWQIRHEPPATVAASGIAGNEKFSVMYLLLISASSTQEKYL